MYYIVINEKNTYEFFEHKDKNFYKEHLFNEKPTGVLYKVEVFGETGDSNDSWTTTWTVDIFSSQDEASDLVEKIEAYYEIFKFLDSSYPPYPSYNDTTEKNKKRINMWNKFQKLNEDKKSELRKKLVDIHYTKEKNDLTVYAAWTGYFESLQSVNIYEIYPAKNNFENKHFQNFQNEIEK